MFGYTANNNNYGRWPSSVGYSAELVIVRLLVRCLYWALTLITRQALYMVWKLAQVTASQWHLPEKKMK